MCLTEWQTDGTGTVTVLGQRISVSYNNSTIILYVNLLNHYCQIAPGVAFPTTAGGPPPTTAGPQATPIAGAVPSYVWVIITIVVVGFVIAVVLALVIFLTRRSRKPKYVATLSMTVPVCYIIIVTPYRPVSHERMYDEQTLDETRSSQSIGIVDNPLYAEDEGASFQPSFAALSAKEKEAEVSRLGQGK